MTLVVAGGAPVAAPANPAAWRLAVDGLTTAAGTTRKDAVAAQVARSAGVPKCEVYHVVHRDT